MGSRIQVILADRLAWIRSSGHSLRAGVAAGMGIVLLSSMTGCTWGSMGTLAARRTLTPSAEVVEVYALGLQLRPAAPDGGATAGWRRAIYFYPRAAGDLPGEPECSWNWFKVNLPSARPCVRGNTTVGMELQATREIQRLALGYQDQLLTLGPAPGQSQSFDFFYVRTNPALTRLHIQDLTP